MSYLNKYLKYKNKYFNLKTKIQGGYKPDLNTLNEMKKYVDDGTFTVHDFIVSQHYNNLQTFFNIIKDNIHLYIIPENFDNFLGKIHHCEIMLTGTVCFWVCMKTWRLNDMPIRFEIFQFNFFWSQEHIIGEQIAPWIFINHSYI